MRKTNNILFNGSNKVLSISGVETKKKLLKHLIKGYLLGTLMLFTSGIAELQAQNLFVRENNGTQLSFTITDIQTITFPQSKVAINKADGSTSTFSFADVQYLSFKDFTTDAALVYDRKQDGLQIYPNPASGRLHITFSSEKDGNIQLWLIDLQGKILQEKKMTCHKGANFAEIPVANLKQGMYLFRLQNQEKIETIKFFKK
ncbi:T9SS type A sorting domain-containing protein [Roseimarinus sediminis]|uniref:T9SS type A sorting domain-containing protein n=1 Tax=Roseimarinus sediminis TaxID=1610899 RepID=UPI003D196D9B